MSVRDEYRELAECALILLGEIPQSGKIVRRKPGAYHKARFWAFGIYSIKVLAFSNSWTWMMKLWKPWKSSVDSPPRSLTS